MTKRENLLSLFRREGYDEVPVEFSLCPSLEKRFKEETGSALNYQTYFGFPWREVDDLQLSSTHHVEQYLRYFDPPLKPKYDIDLWGVGHEHSPNSMHMTYMRNPLKNASTVSDMLSYPFPPYQTADASHQKKQADEIKAQDLAALGNMQCTIWERSWYLRGMENLFVDMMSDDEIAKILFDRVTEISFLRAISFAKAGVDILFLGDDIGMQSTPMMSEELYCTWIKPRLKKIIDAVKTINPDLLIAYHSCGYIIPFIPHLIEVGVDILNPIQTESMSFAEIYQTYGSTLSFHGTIGTQTTMPFGSPQEVKQAVWDNLDIVGSKGGLLVAPTHLLEPEVPWENVLAYVEACRIYKA